MARERQWIDGLWQTVPEGGGGGGGSQTAREAFSGSGAHTSAALGDTKLPWIKSQGDDLLDLSDPTQPTILTTGVYAVQAGVYVPIDEAITAEWFWFGLDLDFDGDAVAFADNVGPFNVVTGSAPVISQAVTYYLTAGAVIVAHMRHQNADPVDCYMQASIQRLS